MEKIINGEKVEIYELNGELRVRKNRCDMPLEDFEKFSNLNPKFYELSDEDFTKLFKKVFPGGSFSR